MTVQQTTILAASILVGFIVLSAAVHSKENDLETCYRILGESMPLTGTPEQISTKLIGLCTRG
ncbi:hypothetical protein DA101_003595 [Sinorhizobium meliloti]|nr:hypothetical protein DA101_003595 [Sinorhizobium meliloti]